MLKVAPDLMPRLTHSVSPRLLLLLRGLGVAALATVLLLLTQHAQAEDTETVWRSTPRPLHVPVAPGKLPRSLSWFNLQTAEINPGHAQDVLQATLGSFPKDADAVLFHVMTWDASSGAATPEPACQHWALLDAHLRALPMSALRSLRHISLVYVTYRHPAQQPVVYTLQEEHDGNEANVEQVAERDAAAAASGLAWGAHTFSVGEGARRVTFTFGRPHRNQPDSPFRNAGYQSLPEQLRMSFRYSPAKPQTQAAGSSSLVPAWMSAAARKANLGGDYGVSPSVGLLLAGNGAAYQPVYTGWITAGIGPPTARVYGGLVTETMMVFHDSLANLNWGTAYGAGAGVHLEWNNKD
jgi:hypothetical protein